MKSMKGLRMVKLVGSIKKRTSGTADAVDVASGSGESPESIAHKNVKAFCESNGNAQNDEVLFLPPIVEAAESSPTAAAECARLVRKYIGKEYSSRPGWQCNAIMLMRILADNPGATFTRNMDGKFVEAAGGLLRNTKDVGVKQMMMDTLDEFERTKATDENLSLLLQVWSKEKEKMFGSRGGRMPPWIPRRPSTGSLPQQAPFNGYSQQNYFSRHHNNTRLPDAVELTGRLEEARTSAKLLEQVVMNTPAQEMLDNELIREFANRCMSASRSVQGYMTSTEPAPDNDTMESLIDTNEQLQAALSLHQRAMLSSRKQLGSSGHASPAPQEGENENDWQSGSSKSKGKGAEVHDPGRGRAPSADEDPFRDEVGGEKVPQRHLSVEVDEDDLYSSSPKRKEPMYRY